MITYKTLYWVVFLILYLGYLFFPRKKEYGMYYSTDFMPLFRFIVSTIVYLISWIVWFIIF
jgi:hypothetical protein